MFLINLLMVVTFVSIFISMILWGLLFTYYTMEINLMKNPDKKMSVRKEKLYKFLVKINSK